MRATPAIVLSGAGGPEVLTMGSIELRPPGPYELEVEVAAAGLNRADLLQRRGLYPPPPGVRADVPGLEYAGRVVAVGDHVTTRRVDDRVMGIVAGGAMARHLIVHEREALPTPPELTDPEAAAIPEAFLTAFDALFDRGGLRLGEAVLIHAAGSGVGTAAVQLAHAAGAKTLGTSRTASKLARCEALGLAHGIVPAEGKFAAQVLAATRGSGAALILDLVGGDTLEENLEALTPQGRIVIVGLLAGAHAKVPLGTLLRKRAALHGTVLRSRPLEEKIALAQAFTQQALPLFSSGVLRPIVEEVLPMQKIGEAHERLERGDTFGKLVLAWNG